jgi:hypothetical protein
VLASRDLMIADFMTYRGIAIMVARLAVSAVVFERIAQLDDADIAVLRARWRAARAALGSDESAQGRGWRPPPGYSINVAESRPGREPQ